MSFRYNTLLILGLIVLSSMGISHAVKLNLESSEISPEGKYLNPNDRPNVFSISLKDKHGNYVSTEHHEELYNKVSCQRESGKALYKHVDDEFSVVCVYDCDEGTWPTKIQIKYENVLLKEYLAGVPETAINALETVFDPIVVMDDSEIATFVVMPVKYYNFYGEQVEDMDSIASNSPYAVIDLIDENDDVVYSSISTTFGSYGPAGAILPPGMDIPKVRVTLTIGQELRETIVHTYNLEQ